MFIYTERVLMRIGRTAGSSTTLATLIARRKSSPSVDKRRSSSMPRSTSLLATKSRTIIISPLKTPRLVPFTLLSVPYSFRCSDSLSLRSCKMPRIPQLIPQPDMCTSFLTTTYYFSRPFLRALIPSVFLCIVLILAWSCWSWHSLRGVAGKPSRLIVQEGTTI
jgi:hypothetical protein